MNPIVEIIASNPPAILLAFGGIGWLLSVQGYVWFLILGTGLQVLWLNR